MLTMTYSKASMPSARRIAEASMGEIELVRGSRGDVNWGRESARSELNPDITNSTNKRRMRELFRDNDVPMPALLDVSLARAYVDQGKAVVGRPDTHSEKRGFWLCRTQADIDKALRGTRLKRPATHFMEFIEADAEFRVHIFKGKSIRMSQKQFTDYDHGEYTMIKPTGRLRAVRRAAKAAVAALGLDFAAVDILRVGREAYVLETNTGPGLGGSMPGLYARTFINWYEGE